MEINPVRQKYFRFTRPYMSRQSVIFINDQNSNIASVAELEGKIIAGDRTSGIEQQWIEQGIRSRFRIRELESKAVSMQMLKDAQVQASIMPLEVGLYLAKQLGVNVRTLESPRSQVPVAIAVQQGDQMLQQKLDHALQQLIASGEIANLYRQRFDEVPTSTVAH